MPPQGNGPEEHGTAGVPADDPWPGPQDTVDGPGHGEGNDQTPLGHDELVALRSSRHVARRPRRRKRWPWVSAIVVLLAGFAAYAVYTYAWPYAQDFLISRNVSSAAAGYPDLTTSFSDGVATVAGEIGTAADAELLIEAIGGIDGVEEVEVDLTVRSETLPRSLEETIVDALADVGITTVTPIVAGSRVTLVGSAADSAMVDLASTVVVGIDGVSQVLNRVVVAADAASAVGEVLRAAGFSTVVVVVRGNLAVLTGTVDADEDALAAADLVLSLAGIEKVDNRLIVGPTTGSTLVGAPTGTPDALVSSALTDAGFDGVFVTFDGATAYLDGVVPIGVLEEGYFAFVEEVRVIVENFGEPETVVNRLRLRGNEQDLRAELKELLDATPIVFLSGSSDLTLDGERALEEAARIILSQPGLQVFIAGHTDASGSADANEQLARQRGSVVFEQLVALGVPANRLAVVSYGELFPGEGSAEADRRIEFEVGP